MSNPAPTPARLTARRRDDGTLVVEIGGDWLDRKGLPDVSAVEQELGGGGVKTVDFEAKELGRWDSTLMVRILALSDLCAKGKVKFRAQTLPENADAARWVAKVPCLDYGGEVGLAF